MATLQINNLTGTPYYLNDIYTNIPANGSVVLPGGVGQTGSPPYPTNALDQGRYLGQLQNMEGMINAVNAGTLSFQVTYTAAELAAYGDSAANPPTNKILPTFGAASTTVALGSNGQALNALTGAILDVASTAGFQTSGDLLVSTSLGLQPAAYTGLTPTSFTGITASSAGTVSTGASVTAA